MKLKAKQIFYTAEVEKELKKQAIDKDMSLTEYITHLLTKQAGRAVKLLIGFALLATLLQSCSDVLCPAYSSNRVHHTRR